MRLVSGAPPEQFAQPIEHRDAVQKALHKVKKDRCFSEPATEEEHASEVSEV